MNVAWRLCRQSLSSFPRSSPPTLAFHTSASGGSSSGSGSATPNDGGHSEFPLDDDFGIPILGVAEMWHARVDDLVEDLRNQGFFHVPDFMMDNGAVALAMRQDAVRLRGLPGKFVPSQSVGETGEAYDKFNVESCELDGHEWEDAPHLLAYSREVMLTLPQLLSSRLDASRGETVISAGAYGTKLAVALGGGSAYPKHVDNACVVGDGAHAPAGMHADQRALTVIYYLNPGHDATKGGQLRIWPSPPRAAGADAGGVEEAAIFDDAGATVVDDAAILIEPEADTLVGFWSDTCVHDVLPNHTDPGVAADHRYALTLWLCSTESTHGGTLCDGESPAQLAVATHF